MKKMMRSILLLALFWYSYIAYIMVVELHIQPIILVLLTILLLVFIQVLRSINITSMIKHKEGEHHEV